MDSTLCASRPHKTIHPSYPIMSFCTAPVVEVHAEKTAKMSHIRLMICCAGFFRGRLLPNDSFRMDEDA